jgi:hypothetical protein
LGNFHISIDGVGTHGQPLNQRDAANMARHFVQDLLNAGHSITQASVTHGGKDDVLNIAAARPGPHGLAGSEDDTV